MLENVLIMAGLMLIGGLVIVIVGAVMIAMIEFVQNGDRE